ncbi:MAG: T9SS type A sorting domain-containing protein, partial [Pedobacter sp.]
LWINPTPGQTESAAGATNATGTGAAPTSTAGIFIRQGGNADLGTGNIQLDEIRIGTTWASVTPAGTAGVNESVIAGLKVYPNPATDIVTVSADRKIENITVIDMSGKKVQSFKADKQMI